MFQYVFFVLLTMVVLVDSSCGASSSSDKSFVKEGNCTWSGPPKCGLSRQEGFSSAYKIDVYGMRAGDWQYDDDLALQQSARLAARFWMQAIKGRPTRAIRTELPKGCGPSSANDTETRSGDARVGDLVICQKVEDLARAIASAEIWSTDRSDGLPRVAGVRINTRVAGLYDRCDWNNILIHELRHALGFSHQTFLGRKLIYQDNIKSAPVFLGANTKREWEAMGGSKDVDKFPSFFLGDGSHWPDDCFGSDELMLRFHVPHQENKRVPLSRMTLAVFQDLGYDVDQNCADVHVVLNRCRRGRYGGPSEKAKGGGHRNRKKKKGKWRSMYVVLFRKQCRRIRLRFTKILKKTNRLWIPKLRKKLKKGYRRVRRVAKARIRAALPKASLANK